MRKNSVSIRLSVASLVTIVSLTVCCPPRALAGQDTQATKLETGSEVERGLKSGETHNYEFRLEAGQFTQLAIGQAGIDVVVRLIGLDGQVIAEIDNPYGRDWPEQTFILAEKGGRYRIEIQAAEERAAGIYRIKSEVLRSATEQDRVQVAAQQTFFEGEQLQKQRTAKALREAIAKFEIALELWRKAGNQAREAQALGRIGFLSSALGDAQKMLDCYQQAVLGCRAVGNRNGEAQALTSIGVYHVNAGNPAQAHEYLYQALSIEREIGDRGGEATTLNNIGTLSLQAGDKREAIDFFERSAAILRERNDQLQESVVQTNIGLLYSSISEFQQSIEHFRRAQALAQERKDKGAEALALRAIGRSQYFLGDYQQALYNSESALQLAQESGNSVALAGALGNLGSIYEELKDSDLALGYFQQALEVIRSMKNASGEASTLVSIGTLYGGKKNWTKALEFYQQALTVVRGGGSDDSQVEPTHWNNFGRVYKQLGDYSKAFDYHQRALAKARAIQDRRTEAATLYYLGLAERARGHLAEAREYSGEAIQIVESIRIKLPNQQQRSSYFALAQDYYELYLDLLMHSGSDQLSDEDRIAGLQISERARARSLLELLRESRADIRQGTEAKLIEQERNLREKLSEKATQQTRLLSGAHTAEQVDKAKKEISQLTADLEELQAKIRTASPYYATLIQPLPLALAEIQQQVMDQESLLLEYSLGTDRSYLWAVTKEKVQSFVLPNRQEIEAQARKVYDLLKVRADGKLDKGEGENAAFARFKKADKDFQIEAATLSEMILGPVAAQLGKKRLLIVADGVLQYIPFAALPTPAAKNQARPKAKSAKPAHQSFTPLIIDHEVINIPSATTLAVLRQQFGERKPAPKAVAVLADPVFDKCDPRVTKPAASSVIGKKNCDPSSEEVARAWRDLRGNDALPLGRLKWTGDEAEGITGLVPKKARKLLVGFEANREAATSKELGDYRFVHFATHGFLNSSHPELSGVVLSLVDKTGSEQDGFLRLQDVYNLKLSADLVVLSACETALGAQVNGEGIIGLTRGFMHAGAPRVVATLWQVGDLPSSELMKRFYAGMLGPKKLSAAAALRQAQLSLWREKNRQSPYYWAAFVLQGEYR